MNQMGAEFSDPSAPPRKWLDSKVGTVVLSFDFLGVPIGCVAGLVLAWQAPSESGLQGILLGLAGIGAAIATLTITALAVQLSVMSEDYKYYVRQVKGGFAGALRPFKIVALVASLATVWALVGLACMPLTADNLFLLWLAVSPPLGLLIWAVLGMVQIVNETTRHAARADDIQAKKMAQKAADESGNGQAQAQCKKQD